MPVYALNINKLSSLDKIAAQIADRLSKGVIYLYGDLGVGKTTFVKLLLKNLGYNGIVSSPSYGLINHYSSDHTSILHADLYRLVEPNELLYVDVDEWTEMADIICIEWPDKGGDLLPRADIEIFMSLIGEQRQLTIKIKNPKLQNIIDL